MALERLPGATASVRLAGRVIRVEVARQLSGSAMKNENARIASSTGI
jgi:hypothetical protein